VTADSLPSQTAAALGVGPKPVMDARLIADLISEVELQARKPRAEHRLQLDLESIERAFGRHARDERARSGVCDARARSARLAEAAGVASEAIALAFAADLFLCLAVERPWRQADTKELLGRLATVLDTTPEAVAVQLLCGTLRAPQLVDLPPLVALEVQLSVLVALGGLVEASLWVRDESGRAECIVSIGGTATTRRFRLVAGQILDGHNSDGQRGLIVGVPVRRWQAPWAALVARASTPETAGAALSEAAEAVTPIIEREFLLERNAARERSLVTASERRLSRLGFDLHDGALQHVAALASDLGRFRAQLEAGAGETPGGDLSSLDRRVKEIDRVLRELAHSLEPASLLRRPLESVIESEAASLRERTGMSVATRISGEFSAMTHSQKIALIRVVQEALTNIREHSNASTAEVVVTGSRSSVDVQIQDDGDGFEVTRTLQDAARRGRLGLVGGSERVRLLGGTFDVRSRAGGPTTVSLTLPRWQPLVAEQESTPQLAFS
jgi:signal transduction histidine kinase